LKNQFSPPVLSTAPALSVGIPVGMTPETAIRPEHFGLFRDEFAIWHKLFFGGQPGPD